MIRSLTQVASARRDGRWFIAAATNEQVTPERLVPPGLRIDVQKPAGPPAPDLAALKAQLELAAKGGDQALALEVAERIVTATVLSKRSLPGGRLTAEPAGRPKKVKDKPLNAFEVDLVKGHGGEAGIQQQIAGYYGLPRLLIPSGLLSVLYGIAFVMCHAHLTQGSWQFSPALIAAARPIIAAFMGVYLFNMGHLFRRLYLSDLTEHVFWGAINRSLLAVGLALVIPSGMRTDLVFFSIGFLANTFLQYALEASTRLLGIGKPQTADLPLRMVKGIDIWKEYRLEEEGIDNVENLATADVIELAIKTHYNVRTLIDWIDQAIVIVRFGEKVRDLSQLGIPVSAIDLAWMSPENSPNSNAAATIADRLSMQPIFMVEFMNGLYEDAYVQTLWRMWQTRPGGKRPPSD